MPVGGVITGLCVSFARDVGPTIEEGEGERSKSSVCDSD